MQKKPFLTNLEDIPWASFSKGKFGSQDKYVTNHLRSEKLDWVLTRLAPGEVSTPYHYHHVDEELFIITEGEGMLRYGGAEVRVKAHDVISCPPGPDGAHQFINDSAGPLTYFAISTCSPVDIVQYPDSDKVMYYAKDRDSEAQRGVFMTASKVDYWEGEA